MDEKVNFNVDYKALIKEKLLDAYEKDPLILEKILQVRNKADLVQKYSFFNSAYLAGVIVSLCPPEVTNLILLLLEVNSNLDSVFQAIGLNFDPRPELAKRAKERKLDQEATLIQDNNIIGLLSEDPEYLEVHEGLEEIRQQIRQQENSS